MQYSYTYTYTWRKTHTNILVHVNMCTRFIFQMIFFWIGPTAICSQLPTYECIYMDIHIFIITCTPTCIHIYVYIQRFFYEDWTDRQSCCTHLHVYVYTYLQKCTYKYIDTYMYTYMYIIHPYIYVHVYMRSAVTVRIALYVYICMYMCVFSYVYMYVYIYTCMYICVCLCMYMFIHACTNMRYAVQRHLFYDMHSSYVWQDSFICVTRLIHLYRVAKTHRMP